MKIESVFDESFKVYGKVLEGYDFASMLDTLEKCSEKPDHVIYVPGCEELEKEEVFAVLENNVYGGMPIQAGYCNGSNTKLNCLEYHRDTEINIVADDIILLVATMSEVENGKLDTAKVKAFKAPKGSAVQLYETTLHYAPCNAAKGCGFRVVVVLPKGTNTDKPAIEEKCLEDKLLWARNKWLIAHSETSEAAAGAFVGLEGENIDIAELI